MGLLRLAVFGPPEVFHDEKRLSFALRKAEALLLYLAVEGGMHSRSQLSALLWPDSEPSTARNALRNSLTLLRSLLADASVAGHSHLLQEHEMLGLNPQAPLERDLDVVQRAWKAAQELTAAPSEEQRAALISTLQCALSLVRGPFLDGFWLREETGFDEWHEQQQQQWQMSVQLLLERLSSWQEEDFQLEPAKATLARWLAFDPLSEEASRRLMRIHLAQGDPTTAGRVYTTLRSRLAEELRIKPSAETVALAERIRAVKTRKGATTAHASLTAENRPPGELMAPLVGRARAFRQLVGVYQQAQQGKPQAMLIVGEAGIGKTRLAEEFVAWTWNQGAEVLRGHVFELGGRLPYQPLVEALRARLEAENAPEDLLDDVWLIELSRLLPELRLRYPDLPVSMQDETAGRLRLFEAVARLMDSLAERAPMVLLLDDLQWVDGASLDLLRYLSHCWKSHGSRVLLMCTVRSEDLEMNPELAAELLDLGRDLPFTRILLQPLEQAETFELLESLSVGKHDGPARPTPSENEQSPELTASLAALGNFLYAQTEGQPLYLLETLKVLRERGWLLPGPTTGEVFRLVPSEELMEALARKESRRELLPPSVRAMIQVRLARLSAPARRLVMANAVLGSPAGANLLWQLADLPVPEGLESLEEAIKSGILREVEAGAGRPASYRFTHDLVRDVAYTEIGATRRHILHQRALALLETEGARVAELAYHALSAGETERAYRYSVQAGDEARAVFAIDEAIGHYEQARTLLRAQPSLQRALSALEVEHLYVRLGRAYGFQNDWPRTRQYYEELLAYAREHQLPALVSMTLNRLAIWVVQQAQDRPQVKALLEEAWQQAKISSDQYPQAETAWNMAQITALVWGEDLTGALHHGQQALSLARTLHNQELEARCLFTLGMIQLLRVDLEEVIPLAEASQVLYARLGTEASGSGEVTLPYFLRGAPLTQSLNHRASEAGCWMLLAAAQIFSGQVQDSLRSGRRSLALAQESKNAWQQVLGTTWLAYALLESGAYEEGLGLMHHTLALAQTFPQNLIRYRFLICLGRAYHSLQQWDEARKTLEEVEKAAYLIPNHVAPLLSQLCMHFAESGEWVAASRYAMQAIGIRQRSDSALLTPDFFLQYETEALLRAGQDRQARAEVQRLGERLGHYQRYRIPYLRSLAILAEWDGYGTHAITHLRDAAELATEIGLPEEEWQIQARLAKVYEATDESVQAGLAWAKAATIIKGLVDSIKDETLRARYVAGPQIQPVLQHDRDKTLQGLQDRAEQS